MTPQSSSDVYLAIYDLSHGMARNLSQQFLGVTIDMIPHTAIIVFGKEYYFGGGVQSVDPSTFRSSTGMRPVETTLLGRTSVAQDDFDRWCRHVGTDRFHARSYDLLQRNCNHFSHEAALQGLRLPRGVPDWVLDVPQRFLSSPMGQLVRPMLEEMQLTQTPPVSGTAPLLAPNGTGSAVAATATARQSRVQSNPWSGRPESAPMLASSNRPNNRETDRLAGTTKATKTAGTTPTSSPASPSPSPSILAKYRAPMLSRDKSTIDLCFKKLLPTLLAASGDEAIEGTEWEALRDRLKGGTGLACDAEEDGVIMARMESSVQELWQILKDDVTSNSINSLALYLLLVLRLVVLDPNPTISIIPTSAHEWMTGRMERPADGWKSPSARSLAWCILSNSEAAAKTSPTTAAPPASLATIRQRLVDAALVDLSPQHETKVEVKQASSTYLYNTVLRQQTQQQRQQLKPRDASSTDLDDVSVSILCSNLDGSLGGETDPTTRLRRLLVVGRILVPIPTTDDGSNSSNVNDVNDTAKNLVHDLGLEGTLLELAATQDTSNAKDSIECQALATELLTRLNG